MTLHPHLRQIETGYNTVLTNLHSGALTEEQAIADLAAITVTDADGWQWALTPDHRWVKAQPGGQPQPADPIAFVSASLPAGGLADPTPWSDPATGPAVGNSFEAQQGLPGSRDLGSTVAGLPQRLRSLLPTSGGSTTRSLTSSSGRGSRLLGSLPERLPRDPRTIAVAGVCVAALAGAFFFLGDSPTGPGIPVAEDSAVAAAPEAPGPLPTTADFDRVVAALASPQDASTVVVNADGAAVARAALLGLDEAGLSIREAAGAVKQGKVVKQQWQLVDQQRQVAAATVTWTRADGQWKLATWPQFAPTSK